MKINEQVVLLVDDSESHLEALRLALTMVMKEGMMIVTGTNLAAARTAWREHADRVVLVICDGDLPDGHGLSWLIHLLQEEKCSVPIFLFSGALRDNQRTESERHGIVCFEKGRETRKLIQAAVAVFNTQSSL